MDLAKNHPGGTQIGVMFVGPKGGRRCRLPLGETLLILYGGQEQSGVCAWLLCRGPEKLPGRSAELGVRSKTAMVGPNHLSSLVLGFPLLPATRMESGHSWWSCRTVLRSGEGPSAGGLPAVCEWDFYSPRPHPAPLIGRW